MTMRSINDPRRLYSRSGSLIVCLGGVYYGPPQTKPTVLTADKEVTCEQLEKSGGKLRIKVTQGKTSENWLQKEIVFTPRGEKTEAAPTPAPKAKSTPKKKAAAKKATIERLAEEVAAQA